MDTYPSGDDDDGDDDHYDDDDDHFDDDTDYEPLTVNWTLFMKHLGRYHQEHGHCFVPKHYKISITEAKDQHDDTPTETDAAATTAAVADDRSHEHHYDYPLGSWVHRIRSQRRRRVQPQQQQQLEALGFEWKVSEAMWMTYFHILCHYQQQHGNCLVPRRFVTPQDSCHLGNWVDIQRKERRKLQTSSSTLTPERIRRLDSLGFDWNPLETQWSTQYDLLCEFREQHGHCRVPQRYIVHGNRLGKWVQEARLQYRKTLPQSQQPKHEPQDSDHSSSSLSLSARMTPERIALLEDIGFDWNPLETRWREMLEQLVEYRYRTGNFNVAATAEYRSLRNWVRSQREAYWKHQKGLPSTITEERIAMLNDIGFLWKASSTRKR